METGKDTRAPDEPLFSKWGNMYEWYGDGWKLFGTKEDRLRIKHNFSADSVAFFLCDEICNHKILQRCRDAWEVFIM